MNDLSGDFTLDDSDIAATVAQHRLRQTVQVNAGLDGNPDDAAEAADLGNMTGDPPALIMANQDEYTKRLRQQTAQALVLNNPALITYIQSHPLAATVSADDWGNLNKFTRESVGLSGLLEQLNARLEAPTDTIGQRAVEGAVEGWRSADLSDEFARYEDPTGPAGKFGAAAAKAGYGAVNLLLQSMSAGMGLASGAARGVGETIGGPRLGRELAAMTEFELTRGDQPIGEHGSAPVAPTPMGKILAAAKPWIDAGEEPPRYVHPDIDAAKAELNAKAVEELEKSLANVQASATHERSPEMMATLIGGEFGDRSIGIHGDAALALYGDKAPAPDDGLLGWVPGIEAQLAEARDIGSDISIPLKDWLAKVDPAVAKGLHDDLRMGPGGITAREAGEVDPAVPPKTTVEEPLPQIRAAAELEPKFSWGDRKITLAKGEVEGDRAAGGDLVAAFEGTTHDQYQMMDETGKPVGELSIVPGSDRTLLVNWVGGQAGLWANSFGPALIRDLKRQLKVMYPDYDYITGYRVSGARTSAGDQAAMPFPKVKLDEEAGVAGHQRMQDILANGWERFSSRIEVNRQGVGAYSDDQLRIGQIAADEINRLTGGRADVEGVAGIRRIGSDQTVRGMYAPAVDRKPTVMFDLLSPDPVGTGRHESVHMLRDYGLVTPDEWGVLHTAAHSEGWLDRYGINERYGHLDDDAKTEEAVAEGFREWAAQAPEVRPKTGVGAVFQKIMDFFDRVRRRFGEALGHEPTWEEVFQRIHSGEAGAREPKTPLTEGAFKFSEGEDQKLVVARRMPDGSIRYGKRGQIHADLISPEESPEAAEKEGRMWFGPTPDDMGFAQPGGPFMSRNEAADFVKQNELGRTQHLHEPSGLQAEQYNRPVASNVDPVQGLANLQAKTVGLPAAEFMNLRDRLIEQQRGDIEKVMRRATAEQEKRQGKEWRENRAEMAAEVSKEIHRRPDVAADLFLGSGEVDGVKLKQRYTLRAEDLTPEQTAALPDHYVSKNGLPADYVAGMFGYGSRGELVENLAKLEAAKRTANGGRMQPMEFMNRLVRGETERRMEAKYGDLAKNVLEDARDQAVSEGSINVLHQELMAAAQQAGVTAFDKDVMRTAAGNLIAETTLGKLSSYRLMQEMGRHGREATKSVLAGDYATATTALTKQTLTAMVAAEARKVEKEVGGFDKLAKQMAKREQKTMAPEFTNWVHDTLMRVGKTVRRSPEDLVREIEASGTGKTLEDFVGYQTRWGGVLGVADQLLDPGWRNGYKELTVAEFRGVNDSVRSLVKAGKDERKVLLAGEMEDLDALRPGFVKGLKEFPVKPFDVEGEVKKPGLVRYAWAQVLQAETVLNRWDKFDRKGTWNQAFFRPLVEGVNQIAAWEKEMAATLRAITNRPLPKRSVENTIFREPVNGELRPMNEENLRTVMLNQGSRSNAERFAGSWKLKPEQVMEWVNRHATKEDWEFVQGVWDALKKPSEWSSNMYRSMSAVPMKLVEPWEVETPFGKMAGGYYPLINHPEYEGKHSTLSGISDNALFGDGYSNGFMPGAGYTVERTRNYTPVAMTMDQLPQRIKQQIRDAALRPGLKNAAKIVRDPQIRDLVKRHYGTEYVDMLEGYLRNIANVESRGGAQSRAAQVTSGALEFVRQNLIATLVGLNPGTVMKHAPTALMLSVNEVGGGRFLRAVREMFEVNDETGENGYGFAMGNSLELQRRSRNWKENLFGASADLQGRGKWSDLRNTMMELSSKPVALSDLASAVPTWLAGYRKSVEEGMSHGDAVYYADQSVRWAHGSTAETTRPMVSNRVSPWFTSLYNFFNDVLNRAVETTWRAGEMVGAAKDGDWPRAKAQVAPVAGGLFCAAIWPAIVEQLVSPVETSKDESTAVRLGKAGAHTIAAMFPIIRDFVQYATGSDSPDVGLFSEAYKAAGEFGKDFGKREPFSPAHAEKMIRDAGTFAGLFTGAPGMQVGRWAGGGYGLATGQEHPQGPWGWLTMARFGTTKGHAETMEDWLHGRARRR